MKFCEVLCLNIFLINEKRNSPLDESFRSFQIHDAWKNSMLRKESSIYIKGVKNTNNPHEPLVIFMSRECILTKINIL